MIRICHGRESTDKTKYIYEAIKAGGCRPCVILVPDQYTLEAEREAFDCLSADVLMDVEVLAFSRLGHRVLAEVGGGRKTHLDPYGRHMLLARITEEKKEQLCVFRGMAGKRAFLEMTNDLIYEMKQQGTMPQDVKAAAEALPDGILKRKLTDIGLLYAGYQEAIAGNYLDGEDETDLVMQKLYESSYVRERDFWVCGFDYFTPKNRKLLGSLMACAKNVSIVLTCDYGGADEELFLLTQGVAEQLRREATDRGLSCQTMSIGGPCRQVSPAIAHIERELFAVPCRKTADSGGITLTASADPFAEAETAAAYVVHLVRDKGLRMRDIALICNDTGKRAFTVKRVFEEWGIPLFMDEKRSITDSPVVNFVMSVLDILIEKYQTLDVFRMLKTGFSDLPDDTVEELENYAIKYRIRGNAWKKPFTAGVFEYGEEKLQDLDAAREQVACFLNPLEETWKKAATVTEKTKALYTFLEQDAAMEEKIRTLSEKRLAAGELERSGELLQVWNAVVRILDQLVVILGEQGISSADYRELLATGLSDSEVGVLPPALDGLMMGTMQRTRPGKLRALLILSANDGLLPRTQQQEGLLSEDEKRHLAQQEVLTGKLSELKAREEKLAIYKTFSRPTEYLWLSWTRSDGEGEKARPSRIFERMRELFPDCGIDADILNREDRSALLAAGDHALLRMAAELRLACAGEKTDEIWKAGYAWYREHAPEKADMLKAGLLFEYQQEKLSREQAQALRSGSVSLSPSRLEKYGRCPFAHFVLYGLRPDERRLFELAGREMGDLYHVCLMRLSQELTTEGVPATDSASAWMTVSEGDVERMIRGFVAEEAEHYRGGILKAGREEVYRTERICRTCCDTAWALIGHVRQGAIETVAFEEPFGRQRRLGPVTVDTSGGRIYIEGKIDRMDVLPGNRVKIIDYKSGSEHFDMEEAKAGWRIQLMLYLRAAMGQTRKPAGVFYFLIDEKQRDVTALGQAQIRKELEKAFRMDGVALGEGCVIESLDSWLAEEDFTGASDIVPIRKLKDGTYSGHVLSETEFSEFCDAVDRKVEELCEELVDGEVAARPKRSKNASACDYCRYKGVCRFDTSFSACRYDTI